MEFPFRILVDWSKIRSLSNLIANFFLAEENNVEEATETDAPAEEENAEGEAATEENGEDAAEKPSDEPPADAEAPIEE